MSEQQRITSFFRASKQNVNGCSIKRRKLEFDGPCPYSDVTVETMEETVVRDVKIETGVNSQLKLQLTTPQSETRSENARKRKVAEKLERDEKLEAPTARKRLVMDVGGQKTPAVPFQCKGLLSPKKKTSQELSDQLHVPVPVSPLPKTPTKLFADPKPVAGKSPAMKSLAEALKTPPKFAKKLTPEEIKARLGKVSSLADLRAKLATVNKCSVKLKEFSSIKVDLLVSPVKSSPVKYSPVKSVLSSDERRPAERFHALLQPSTIALPLPYKYRYLAEVFRCVDTVVSMMYNRQERVTFEKLKPSVQQMTRKNFTEQHLGQIHHVFPTAYHLEIDKNSKQKFSPKKGSYELTVTPNLDFLEPGKGPRPFQPLEPRILMERKTVFHNCLMKMMHQHHAEFLATLDPPLSVSEDQITRWHERFDVDGVPDVPAAPLPKAPCDKPLSAKDVLERAKSSLNSFPELEAALKTIAVAKDGQQDQQGDAAGAGSSQSSSVEPVKPAQRVNPALKGVPQAIIDKIRAKEAARAIAAMTISSEDLRKREIHSRLPELVRITCGIFCLEKRSAFPFADFVSRLRFGYNDRLSLQETAEHVRYLVKTVPQWIKLVALRGVEYVKIDRNLDENQVVDALQKISGSK